MSPKRKAWAAMLAVYLAGVAVALNLSKVPPVMQVLIEQLNVDTTTGGWLMSAFAVAGLILGLPAAVMLVRWGPKISGMIALGCTILGSTLGALATGPAGLLAGRAVEGVGMGLITVIAPSVISMWFPPEQRGTPMGIWASWVPVGGFMIYNLAGPLLRAFGWQGVWWFGASLALLAFLAYGLVVNAPENTASTKEQARVSDRQAGRLLLNPASWILALVFAAFNFTSFAFATWAPSYFSQALGMQPDAASFNASLSSLAVIPSTIAAGWILDRIHNRRLVLIAALVVFGFLMMWSFRLGGVNVVAPYMVVLGLVVGFIPTSTFTFAPETVPGPHAGLALGIVSVGQNLGMLLGPPIVGALIAGGNWAAGVLPLVVSAGVGAAASLWFARVPAAVPTAAARVR